MKRLTHTILALLLLAVSHSANAWWGGGNGWNDWPVWTPMYWMEEMVGDDDWYGYPGWGGYGYPGGWGGYPGGWGGYPGGSGYGYPGGWGGYPGWGGYGYPGGWGGNPGWGGYGYPRW